MSTEPDAPFRNKYPIDLILGVLFTLLMGVIALYSAMIGFQGKGSAADMATAWPNIMTGIASLIGGVGYLRFKKWSIPVYAVAVIGHFVSHGELIYLRTVSRHITIANVTVLAIVPLIALVILGNMARQLKTHLVT